MLRPLVNLPDDDGEEDSFYAVSDCPDGDTVDRTGFGPFVLLDMKKDRVNGRIWIKALLPNATTGWIFVDLEYSRITEIKKAVVTWKH